MQIISLEGLDKSGKHTQSILLEQALRERGYRVVRSEFHRYDTPTGELIRKWLTHEWPVDQWTVELIMAADKYAQQTWFEKLEEQGTDILILDRYITSQLVYSQASGVEREWVFHLVKGLRFPDIEILIDIPPEVSMQRKGKHNGGKNDRYESDLALLTRAREYYLEWFKSPLPTIHSKRYIIDGEQDISVIHQRIMNIILP